MRNTRREFMRAMAVLAATTGLSSTHAHAHVMEKVPEESYGAAAPKAPCEPAAPDDLPGRSTVKVAAGGGAGGRRSIRGLWTGDRAL